MLRTPDGNDFATGRARFTDDAPWAAEPTAKIYVKITPENLGVVLIAMLDTGAPWSILDAEVAENLNLFNGDGEAKSITMWQGHYDGRLERVGLRLLADEGHSLEVEATVFVCPEWRFGNFLGYGGLLQNIRFAVDATHNLVYFGRE
jgi:hypothetical protein